MPPSRAAAAASVDSRLRADAVELLAHRRGVEAECIRTRHERDCCRITRCDSSRARIWTLVRRSISACDRTAAQSACSGSSPRSPNLAVVSSAR